MAVPPYPTCPTKPTSNLVSSASSPALRPLFISLHGQKLFTKVNPVSGLAQ